VASAGPYASLHLAPEKQLHKHPHHSVFYRPDALPTNSVKALKAQSTGGSALITLTGNETHTHTHTHTPFNGPLSGTTHVLHGILPDHSDFNYNIRPRRHNLVLTAKSPSITDRDYITRMIFKNIYRC